MVEGVVHGFVLTSFALCGHTPKSGGLRGPLVDRGSDNGEKNQSGKNNSQESRRSSRPQGKQGTSESLKLVLDT